MRQGRFALGEFMECALDATPCDGRIEAGNRGCTCGAYSAGDVVFAAEHKITAATRAEFHEAYKAAPKRSRGLYTSVGRR